MSFYRFSVRSIMHKHLMKMGEVTFDKIFNQKLGECCGKYLHIHFTRVCLENKISIALQFPAVRLTVIFCNFQYER